MLQHINTEVGPIWYPTYDSLPRDEFGKLIVDDQKMVESINNLAKLAILTHMV